MIGFNWKFARNFGIRARYRCLSAVDRVTITQRNRIRTTELALLRGQSVDQIPPFSDSLSRHSRLRQREVRKQSSIRSEVSLLSQLRDKILVSSGHRPFLYSKFRDNTDCPPRSAESSKGEQRQNAQRGKIMWRKSGRVLEERDYYAYAAGYEWKQQRGRVDVTAHRSARSVTLAKRTAISVTRFPDPNS